MGREYVTANSLLNLADVLKQKIKFTQELSFPTGFYDIYSAINLYRVESFPDNLIENWIEGSSLGMPYLFDVEEIKSNTFYEFYDSQMVSVTLLGCKKIGQSAFFGCSYLQNIVAPNCIIIEDNAFQNCFSLETIDLSVCSKVGYSCFQSCSNLFSVNLPECTYISPLAFASCRSLQTINLPNCSIIASNAFSCCSSLTSVVLNKCKIIYSYAFASCTNLKYLFLLSDTITSLYYTNTFSGAAIQNNSSAKIFVPEFLVSSYKKAQYWSAFSSKIFKYEENSN